MFEVDYCLFPRLVFSPMYTLDIIFALTCSLLARFYGFHSVLWLYNYAKWNIRLSTCKKLLLFSFSPYLWNKLVIRTVCPCTTCTWCEYVSSWLFSHLPPCALVSHRFTQFRSYTIFSSFVCLFFDIELKFKSIPDIFAYARRVQWVQQNLIEIS